MVEKLKNMGVSPVGVNNADGIECCRVKSMLDYRENSGKACPVRFDMIHGSG